MRPRTFYRSDGRTSDQCGGGLQRDLPMKYAFVVPRYGLEVVGGAELGARMLAERLVSRLGWSVEIFTTRARDIMTWADEYPDGDETINGVVVHRYSSASGRPPAFFPFSERVLSAPAAATVSEAEQFLTLQGPVSPDLVDALASSPVDLFAFYPYLYHPTVAGMAAVGSRSILHPAAHDEPALHLPVFRDVIPRAQGLVFQTDGERELVERLFHVAQVPHVVVGLGFEEPPSGSPPGTAVTGGVDGASLGNGVSARPTGGGGDLLGIGERPYLCCLGRVDGFKGTSMLAGFFAAYKERRPGPLALALVGPVTADPQEHPDVIVTGAVDEAAKWTLLRGATALVNPSPHEAFSIVLMEGWSVGLPVVVNGRCAATREHCERSGGGLAFESYPEFEAVVDRLTADAELREQLGGRGRTYVDANFRWPVIIDRYGRFAESVLARR